jgi:hypothetical protein
MEIKRVCCFLLLVVVITRDNKFLRRPTYSHPLISLKESFLNMPNLLLCKRWQGKTQPDAHVIERSFSSFGSLILDFLL